MLKNLVLALATTLSLALLLATSANALTYNFDSGNISVTAVQLGTGISVLEPGTSPLMQTLGGSFVDFEPLLGPDGTITGLELVPVSDFTVDLDQTVTGYDLIDVNGAILEEALGATALVSGVDGSFALDTVMSATIEGVGGPPVSTPITSINSGAVGQLGLSGDTITMAVFGINIATFPSIANPGTFIEVKADFLFVGTAVPEPTSALLLGLGLAGLASVRRQA